MMIEWHTDLQVKQYAIRISCVPNNNNNKTNNSRFFPGSHNLSTLKFLATLTWLYIGYISWSVR